MSVIEEEVRNKLRMGTIMVVDDNPTNLRLLEEMLRRKGYEVRLFPDGQLALSAATKNPPDLILLDVNMPHMTGYEFCKRLKVIEVLAGIPIIFVSAMNQTEDKVKGFLSGGVDYIAKPFQFAEVFARIETHLKLRRAQKSEHDLLEQTLNGAVTMLSELLHLSSPVLAARSLAIRECVAWMTNSMNIIEPWAYDLAATLSLVGCVALPEETFQKGYRQEILSPDEEAMFRAHPQSAARLVANIPRLEPVAEMIRMQQTPDLSASVETRLGARMLFLAIEVDRRVYRGLPFRVAFQQLQSMSEHFDPGLLEALDNYSPAPTEFHTRTLTLRQLVPGVSLEEDLVSDSSGITIFRRGTVLTETWIERIGNFAKSQGVREPLRVRVPGPAPTQDPSGNAKAAFPKLPVNKRGSPR